MIPFQYVQFPYGHSVTRVGYRIAGMTMRICIEPFHGYSQVCHAHSGTTCMTDDNTRPCCCGLLDQAYRDVHLVWLIRSDAIRQCWRRPILDCIQDQIPFGDLLAASFE